LESPPWQGPLPGAESACRCPRRFHSEFDEAEVADVQQVEPQGGPGILLGCFLQPGHVWKGEYLAAALEDCVDIDLRESEKGSDAKLPVHRVRELVVDAKAGRDFKFPLKARYDRENRTVEGLGGEGPSTGDPLASPRVAEPGEDEERDTGLTAETVALPRCSRTGGRLRGARSPPRGRSRCRGWC
jgi:hypothetical protein